MKAAFTLIELLIVIGMIAILFTFSTINLLSLQHKTNLNDQVSVLSADLTDQQLKAMTGNTAGTGTRSDYGIHFDSDGYTLFKGSNYNANDNFNYHINLPETIRFTNILFPNSQIVFQKGSGEIVGFSSLANTFTLSDSTQGESKTFYLNMLGVINQIQ